MLSGLLDTQIEANLLYNFFPELNIYQMGTKGDSTSVAHTSHLQVLLEFIKSSYKSTNERLQSLLRNKEITYDLLWALFKPNSDIYTTCAGTEEPMCVRCNHGDEKVFQVNGTQYFSLEARQLDYDGKVFGEATVKIAIEKFRGAKKIDLLEAYPLQYHRHASAIKRTLIESGRAFVSMLRTAQHRKYQGKAFWKDEKGGIHPVPVNGRIMVDPSFFRHINPDYARAQVDESLGILYREFSGSTSGEREIKHSEVALHELDDHDLLVCSPTVPGFSLVNKQWRE